MYLGHLAFGLGARRLRFETPFAMLLIAPLWLDVVDAVLGVLHVPDPNAMWSHSVLAAIGWSVLLGGFAAWRSGVGWLMASLVFSHWLCDLLTSRLTAWPGGPVLGLHLYAHRGADCLLELCIIAVGWALYRGTLPVERRGHAATWGMLALLVTLQLAFAFLPIG